MKISELRQIIKEEIADALGSKSSFQDLDNIAQKLKASVDSDDPLSITVNPPTKIDGKMYYGIEQDDPERFNEFKYGAYAVKEAWGPISRVLGLESDDYDAIDYVIDTLRNKKLIHLEW